MLHGCGEGNNLTYAPTSFNFSVTGNLFRGDTLRFQSSAGDNSVFQWTFGDGNSSTQPSPYHVYYTIAHNNAGAIVSDTVTLVINNDIYHPVIKTINLKPPVPRL